jgi:hypothetical protein
MKVWMTIFALLAISSTSLAATLDECKEKVVEAAHENLYLKSKSFRVRATDGQPLPANIRTERIELKKMNRDGGLTATMEGNILKGIFIIDVTVDSDCSVTAVKITENGEY